MQSVVVKKTTLEKFVFFLAGMAERLWPVLSRCNLMKLRNTLILQFF